MTKPITSVAMMMLVEQGLVALDDPVHRHIPAWRDLAVYVAGGSGLPGAPGLWQTKARAGATSQGAAPHTPSSNRPSGGLHVRSHTRSLRGHVPLQALASDRSKRRCAIIDLLRHTSGLTYGFQSRTNVDAAYRANKIDALERDDGLDGFIDALTKVPLEFSPGTAWNYSVSTDVLGFLVSKISGLPFDEFLRQHILRPLGMHDTDFFVPPDKACRLAQCYVRSAEGRAGAAAGPQRPGTTSRAFGRQRAGLHRSRLHALL